MPLEYFGLVPLFSAAAAANRIAGYRAPEVVETRKVTQKSDVYSFGVLHLELLTGKAPNQASLNDEGIAASVIHSFRGSFTNSQRERSLDPSMAAGRAAVGTRWMETAPPQRYLLCSKIRRNSLSGRWLDTIAEERTLSNEELVAGLQSAFHNLGNLETIMEGKNGKDAQEGLQFCH